MLLGLFISVFTFAISIHAQLRGGGPKCITCPQCMVCDPKAGCQYSNFGSCLTTNKKKGVCYYGNCTTTIKLPKTPLSICKTYEIPSMQIVNEMNGLGCSLPGALINSFCVNGQCLPFVDAFNVLGQNIGCNFFPDNTMCDSNGVFTDGERCVSGLCTMPYNPQNNTCKA